MPKSEDRMMKPAVQQSCHCAGTVMSPVRMAWKNIPWMIYTSRLALPNSEMTGLRRGRNFETDRKHSTKSGSRKTSEKYL